MPTGMGFMTPWSPGTLQWVGLSYSRDVGSSDLLSLMSLGLVPRVHAPAVNALLLGQVEDGLLHQLSDWRAS